VSGLYSLGTDLRENTHCCVSSRYQGMRSFFVDPSGLQRARHTRNNSKVALLQIAKFSQGINNTNIIVLDIPHRYDLGKNSCVNKEIQSFNQKLRKLTKLLKHVSVLEVSSNREDFAHTLVLSPVSSPLDHVGPRTTASPDDLTTIRPFSGPHTPVLISYWFSDLVHGCWQFHSV
jgi:hypothetical protein